MNADPTMYIRITPRRRTFHTHGFPYPHGGGTYGVRVHTWAGSRRILNRAYRDLRAFGLSRELARSVTCDLLLVPK